METYRRTVFIFVQGMFALGVIVAVLVMMVSIFDHGLRAEEIGDAGLMLAIGIAGFLLTGLINRVLEAIEATRRR